LKGRATSNEIKRATSKPGEPTSEAKEPGWICFTAQDWLVREAVDGNAVGTEQTRGARVEGATWDRRAAELVALGGGSVP